MSKVMTLTMGALLVTLLVTAILLAICAPGAPETANGITETVPIIVGTPTP